jgi:hypothetical protein
MIKDWQDAAWPFGDPIVEDLAHEQGFDGLPATGTRDELDEAVQAGGIEIWRGYGPIYDWPDGRTATAAPIGTRDPDQARREALDNTYRAVDQWRDGEYKAGHGIYGQGTYTSGSLDAAKTFGVYGPRYGFGSDDEGDRRTIQRMVLAPHARIFDYGTDPNVEAWGKPSERSKPIMDPGRHLAALGYDAMRIPAGEDDGTGLDAVQYVIFNRTALIVEEPSDGP